MTSFASNPILRDYWYPVVRAQDLGDRPIALRVLCEDIAVWRARDGFAGAYDRCPHREAPLSMGTVNENGHLVCCYHGWHFDGVARCVRIPSQEPNLPIPPKAHARGVQTREAFGLVWVCLGTPAAEIPAIPEADDPAYRVIPLRMHEWRASATRMIDNFADYSHFHWSHGPSFGSTVDPYVAPMRIEADGDRFGYRFDVEAANPALAQTTSGVVTATVDRRMHQFFRLPFYVIGGVEYSSGLRHLYVVVATPIDDDRTLFGQYVVRNDDHSVPPEEAIRLDLEIIEEDRIMLEAIPGPLPLGPTALAQVRSDKCGIEWARRFQALLAGASR
ncbi:MAG: Rieske 2Fe-2S domain-containing protein [Acidimicrobiales bacterium]